MYRYSIDYGKFGGIVIADTKIQAAALVKEKYSDYPDNAILVWRWEDDDYYDPAIPSVIECYGI